MTKKRNQRSANLMSVYRQLIQDASILLRQEKKRHSGAVAKGKCRGSMYNEDSKMRFMDHNKNVLG